VLSDRACGMELDFEHRLNPPRSLQTNHMVKRFNGCTEDVLEILLASIEELTQNTIITIQKTATLLSWI
jgi:hypothetical protein